MIKEFSRFFIQYIYIKLHFENNAGGSKYGLIRSNFSRFTKGSSFLGIYGLQGSILCILYSDYTIVYTV